MPGEQSTAATEFNDNPAAGFDGSQERKDSGRARVRMKPESFVMNRSEITPVVGHSGDHRGATPRDACPILAHNVGAGYEKGHGG